MIVTKYSYTFPFLIIYHLRFLGKYLSQYVSVLVEEGEGKVDIVSQGFDYVKWKRTQERNKVSPVYL